MKENHMPFSRTRTNYCARTKGLAYRNRMIRRRYDRGEGVVDIAAHYGITHARVYQVLNNPNSGTVRTA
jgi:Mor family transcriptional regulator